MKPYKGPAMEGMIAGWYARNTKKNVDRFRACADALVATLPTGARVLEVAPGPGYLAIEIARRADLRVTGLDISESFVRIARANAEAAGVAVDFQHGNASQMPFPSESFDFVVTQAAFKNFTDPVGALDELHRVLAPGGQASVQDLRREASPEEIAAEVKSMNLSRMSTLWTKLVFRSFLLKNAYSETALLELVGRSRFGRGEIRRDGIGFDLRLAKSAAQSRVA